MSNAKDNAGQPKQKRLGGCTGKGFMPGKSGNPRGASPVKGLVKALRAAMAEVQDGQTVEQHLVRALIVEAFKGTNRLAAITAIFDRLEGKPRQQLDLNDITEKLAGRTDTELLHFAQTGEWK